MAKIKSLKPLRRTKEASPGLFGVCDIESANWTRFLIIGFYDGREYRDFERLYDFFDYLFTHKNGSVIYAHFGGKFDFMFLLDFIFSQSRFMVSKMIPRGSGILCFDLEDAQGRKLSFRDSSAMLPYSLRSLCENFKVDHQKLEVDYEKIVEVTDELRTYLEHDCKGLYECLERYFNWNLIRDAGSSFTIAGQAMKILRLFLPRPVAGLSEQADSFVRQAYFGGRTEIFKPLYDSKHVGKPLYCFDVNSLYPTVMREFEYPGRCRGYSKKYQPNRMGFYDAEVEVPENMYVPPLGVVHEFPDKTKKFIFPTGRFRGRWSTCELEYARSIGVKIISTGTGILFDSAGMIFKDFIDTLYQMRLDSPKDSVDNVMAKLVMNSCYGRFGLNREREMLEMDSGQLGAIPVCELGPPDRRMRLVKIPKVVDSFTNVAVAAWVTSQARIYMHKIYRQCQDELYYTDTDSLFTTMKFPDASGLGALKLEYEEASGACFLLPKTYRAGKKVVMKGFDRKKIQHFTHDDFVAALEGDLRRLRIVQSPKFATFKTALRKRKLVTMVDESSREIRSEYDKRQIVKIGNRFDTVPLHIS